MAISLLKKKSINRYCNLQIMQDFLKASQAKYVGKLDSYFTHRNYT